MNVAKNNDTNGLGPIVILGSSGGSALAAALKILDGQNVLPNLHIVTDRPCGLFDLGVYRGIPATLVEWNGAQGFTAGINRLFAEIRPRVVLLFYTRLIPGDLLGRIPYFNIHPALLPAYPGIQAPSKAHGNRARITGATLHVVDQGMDTGPIVAQVSSPVPAHASLAAMEKIAYVHKVYLTLLFFEMYLPGSEGFESRCFEVRPCASPCINDPETRDAFMEWQRTFCPGVVFYG